MSKIFISYSDHSSTYAAVREQLIGELGPLPVWYDAKEIAVGDEWLKRITAGLGSCYAGIFLVSKEALRSDFVRYEVSYLLQRSRMDSRFKLFALLLDDASPGDLQTGFFGSVRFLDSQVGSFAQKRAEVIAALKALPLPILTPTRELEDHLLKYFREVALTSLRRIAQAQGWMLLSTVGEDAEVLQFVRLLVGETLAVQLRVLREVKKGLPHGCSALQLFETLAPTWVDESAALQLAQSRSLPPTKRGAVLNGTLPDFTVKMFLQRALPIAELGRLSSQQLSGRQALEAAAKRIRETLSEELTLDVRNLDAPQMEAAVNAKLDKLDEYGVLPVHTLMLETSLDLPIVGALQKRFPRVTFVVMTKAKVEDGLGQVGDHLTIVTPQLSYDDKDEYHNETYAWTRFNDRYAALG